MQKCNFSASRRHIFCNRDLHFLCKNATFLQVGGIFSAIGICISCVNASFTGLTAETWIWSHARPLLPRTKKKYMEVHKLCIIQTGICLCISQRHIKNLICYWEKLHFQLGDHFRTHFNGKIVLMRVSWFRLLSIGFEWYLIMVSYQKEVVMTWEPFWHLSNNIFPLWQFWL